MKLLQPLAHLVNAHLRPRRRAVRLALGAALAAALAAGGAAHAQRGPILNTYPQAGEQNVWPGTTINLSFDRAMDDASVEAAFSLQPNAVVRMRAVDDKHQTFTFEPLEPLAVGTKHTAAIAASVRDARGTVVIADPLTWSFTTGVDNAQMSFGWSSLPLQFLSPGGQRRIAVQPGYPRVTLDATLYAVDEAGLVARLAAVERSQSGGKEQTIDVTGLTEVERWQSHVDTSDGNQALILPKSVGAGAYVIDVGSPRLGHAKGLLLVTDYGLVAKRGLDGLTTWLTKVPAGVPTGGAALAIYDGAGANIGASTTDVDGLGLFAATLPASYVVARVGDQFTVLGLSGTWQSGGFWWGWRGGIAAPDGGGGGGSTAGLARQAGHIHTDRPIYRPGHTVHWKASLRAITLDGYRVLDASTPVTVTIRDAGGNMVQRARHASDAYGSVAGDLALDPDASRGSWSIEVSTAAQTFYGRFQVEDYVKPDYEVTVATDRPWYVQGDNATVTVGARYYFGQPAAGAEAVIRAYYGWGWRNSGQAPIATFNATLDADGKASVTIALPAEAANQLIAFEAEVTDASRRPVVAETSAMVYPAAFDLTLETDRYGLKVGEALAMTLHARDHDGKGVAGVKTTVALMQWDTDRQVVRRTVTATTGADGTAPVRFEGLIEGWYELQATATDAGGHAVTGYGWAWFYDNARPWYWWGSEIELRLDRATYQPGETAQLLIKSPVTTTALVTIERDAVHTSMIVPVSGATTVALPISADYAPNAFVTVSLWRNNADRGGYNRAEGRLLTSSIQLVVPAEDKRLRVAVVPDSATHAPGDEGRFTLRVTDAAGRPVKAQLSFALVDKAVLALAKDTSGSLFDAFWTNWAQTVGTFDSLQPTQGYGGPEAVDGGAPGRGGSQPPMAPSPDDKNRDAADTTPAPRRNFPDTAFWKADLETNDAGEVIVSLTLPDSLTTWVGIARAIAVDARVGEAKAEVTVSKAVQADLALPRFAVQGDRFAVDVIGRNYARPNGPLAGRTTLDAPSLVQLDPGARDVSLPYNTTQSTRYSVVASQVGEAPVHAALTTDAGDDALELPLPIVPFAVPDRFVRAGAAESAKAIESFDVPFNAQPDASSVEIRLAPGVAASILDGVDALIGYPYGCVEQTMSRMMPNAIVARMIKDLGIEAPEVSAKLPEYMTVGLQKLYGFQNADGSWGWWGGATENYYGRPTYLTAYVLHGLVLARDAGFDVDGAVLDRGFAWLTANAADETDARLRSYAAFVLANAGRGDVDFTLKVFADRGAFEPFARAMLVLALDRLGRGAEADVALDELIRQADVSGADAFWPMVTNKSPWGYPEWDGYQWRTMASAQKYTATALQALIARRPMDPLAIKAAHWLMGHRDGAGWYTTHDTAFAILGLTDYAIARGELQSAYDWTVALDGRTVGGGHVDATNITKQIPPIKLAGAAIAPGAHQLTIEKRGAGALYYTVVGQMALYYDGFAETKAAGLGIDLSRTYTPLRTEGKPEGAASGDWAVGDIVNVHVELSTKEDLSYIMIADQLPAGLEALNDALDTESKRVPDGQEGPWRWRWWGYERKEIRDQGVTFFATYLPAGTHGYDYAARAITPGEFSARPAEAYAMYRPEVWGRSASAKVAIATARVAERPALTGDFDRDCRLTAFDASLVADRWASGAGRDVNGDGRTSVADIALAASHAGAQCGQAVAPPPAPSGDVALHAAYPTANVGDTATLPITVEGATAVGAVELTVRVPSGWRFIGVDAGDRLHGATVLAAPDAGTVRVAAFATADGTSGSALLTLTLQRVDGEGDGLAVTGAEVTTAGGRPYTVTVDGEVVTTPVKPSYHAFLPSLTVMR
ncbi:MAG: MG2 domain-containing protein [Ardenticatenales bacterium]